MIVDKEEELKERLSDLEEKVREIEEGLRGVIENLQRDHEINVMVHETFQNLNAYLLVNLGVPLFIE